MTPPGGAWNEAGQSEGPAVELLKKLGYVYVPAETLEAERDSLRDVVLVARLEAAQALKSNEAKASEMEHAIRHEILVRLEEDPTYFQSLRERLERIIADKKARRLDEAEQLSLLQGLINDTRGHARAADNVGIETGFAI